MSANAIAGQAKAERTDRLQALYDEALEHSRLARFHHNRARARFKEFKRFKATLEAMGMTVIVEEDPKQRTNATGGKSDRHENPPAV